MCVRMVSSENIPLIVQFFPFRLGRGRYAALLSPLLKSLEFVLTSSAASLMAAACISASLGSKFENATTIKSPHIARVESTYRRATCSPNTNAETAASANSQKNFLRRRLCNFILFWRLIEPTPFVCFDGALTCGPSRLHTGQTHLPPSFSHLSTALFSSVFGI
jgi:hypothetical protein